MRLTIFTVLLTVSQFVFAQSSKISEVMVYLQGAEVTREVKLNLNSGLNDFEIKGLSGDIDPNSVQISGLGQAKIAYVNLERDYLTEIDIPSDIAPLIEQLQESEFNLQIRRKVLNAYNEERSLLLENKKVLGEQSTLKVADLVELANLYRNRLKEIELKNLEISEEIKELEEKIQKLNAQLGPWKQMPKQSQNKISLGISSATTGALTVKVKYIVRSAGWTPSYDIVATDNNKSVKLVYKASVYQRSGVNWDNVSLSFSTSTPLQYGNLPSLYPDYVNIVKPEMVIRGARAKSFNSADAESMELSEVVVGGYDYGTQSNGNVSAYFSIPGKHKISSFGKAVSLGLKEHELAASMSYLLIPKASQDAFLSAKITGFEGLGLLPGNAHMYYNDALTGQSYIQPNPSENSLDVSLGRDAQIAIERKSVRDVSKEGNIISANRKNFHYEIVIRNNKNVSIDATVKDQIPISRNAEVTVTLEDASAGNVNSDTGIITWDLKLSSGEQKKLTLKYNIKFPKGEKINQ